MRSSPNRLTSDKSKKQKLAARKKSETAAQHESSSHSGRNRRLQLTSADTDADAVPAVRTKSVLERMPFETLCHCVSYLDPPSLASLSGVSIYFREFLSDDLVWKLALFANLLDIRPECNQEVSSKAFLLRRIEPTWKAEYIERFRSLIRWSQSKTPLTAHHPMVIPVSSLHLLSDGESLLVAPEHFSWVFRTVPSTGKIYKGYYQPTLPNQAHPPNDWSPPAAGAITSDGNMAKIAWASQAGDVMVKTAPILADSKPIPRTPRIPPAASSLEDRHNGFINSISWASLSPKIAKPDAHATSTTWLITTASDGHVKIWNANCEAVWTSPYSPDGAPFIRAEFDLTTTTAVAVSESGMVMAWVNLPVGEIESSIKGTVTIVSKISLEAPKRLHTMTTKLQFDRAAPVPSVIVHIQEDIHAFRFHLESSQREMACSKLVGPLGPITAMELGAPKAITGAESSTLFVGDSLSLLSIYDLGNGTLSQEGVKPAVVNDDNAIHNLTTPNLTLTTHDFGAITAIATNAVVLIVGNDLGVITIWDAITLATVRTIDASKLVKHDVGVITLLCQKEQVIASVGNAVVHWRTGSMPSRIKKQGKVSKTTSLKGKHRIDEHQLAIRESQAELEMTSRRQLPVVYSEREQRAALEALGLDESGAVEYALMISRDEAAQKGIPDLGESISEPHSPTGTSTSSDARVTRSTTPSSGSASTTKEDFVSSSLWKLGSSSHLPPPDLKSVGKVQISPPYHAETMRTGLSKRTSMGHAKSWSGSDKGSGKEEAFPRISPPSTKNASGNSAPIRSGATTPPVQPPVQPKISAPIKTSEKSWSGVVKSSRPSPSLSGFSTPGNKGTKVFRATSSARAGTPSRAGGRGAEDEEAQLQFALELSLAEAMSRQE